MIRSSTVVHIYLFIIKVLDTLNLKMIFIMFIHVLKYKQTHWKVDDFT